jgi:hypothetical protein
MDMAVENSEPAVDRPGPILTIVSMVQRTVRWLVGLVFLTEQERIKAGVHFGHEKP